MTPPPPVPKAILNWAEKLYKTNPIIKYRVTMSKEKNTTKTGARTIKRKKMALGKGLGALIPDLDIEEKD